MIADLDTLLIALYVELTDRIPALGFTLPGPGASRLDRGHGPTPAAQ